MQTEAKVVIYTCDAADCDVEAVAQNGDLPEGVTGTVKWSNATGDFEAQWFAHTDNHIRKAVTAVRDGVNEASEGPAPVTGTSASTS